MAWLVGFYTTASCVFQMRMMEFPLFRWPGDKKIIVCNILGEQGWFPCYWGIYLMQSVQLTSMATFRSVVNRRI
jgi:hypothetical protein